jgi:hypothetical protein
VRRRWRVLTELSNGFPNELAFCSGLSMSNSVWCSGFGGAAPRAGAGFNGAVSLPLLVPSYCE